MEVEREALLQAAVATLGVVFLVAVMIFIGIEYNDRGLGQDGGLALIGALVAFILVMSVIGYWLAGREE